MKLQSSFACSYNLLLFSRDENCVVDVFDVVDGSRIPFKKSLNKYLVKVDALDILKGSDVFLKAIEICEKARSDEVYY